MQDTVPIAVRIAVSTDAQHKGNYSLHIPHPRIMAKKSRESVPFSCIAMAMPTAIQRWG